MSKRILKDYMVASSAAEVVEKCAQGYELYGYPAMHCVGDGWYSFAQALVKYETEEDVSASVDPVKSVETLPDADRLRLRIAKTFSGIVISDELPNECILPIWKISSDAELSEMAIAQLMNNVKQFMANGYIYTISHDGYWIDRRRVE